VRSSALFKMPNRSKYELHASMRLRALFRNGLIIHWS
jgi:hypothetical protein